MEKHRRFRPKVLVATDVETPLPLPLSEKRSFLKMGEEVPPSILSNLTSES